MKKYIVRLIVLFTFVFFSACRTTHSSHLKSQGKLDKSTFLEILSFDYHKDLILLEIEMAGERFSFIYDTGAELTLLHPDILDKIPMKKLADKTISDSGGVKKKLTIVELPTFKMGNVEFTDFAAITVDMTNFKNHMGCERKVDGILGNNVFRKAVWKIDYQNQQLTLSDDIEKLKESKPSYKLTTSCEKTGNAVVKADVNGIVHDFTYDTGYTGQVTSNQKLFTTLQKENPTLIIAPEKGVTSISLHGYNYGIINHVIVEQFETGELILENIVVELKDNSQSSSLMGNELWQNYIVTMDWKNCDLYLSPNRPFIQETIETFAYKFIPDYEKNLFRLGNAFLNHPEYFDISPENIVHSINDFNLQAMDDTAFCQFREEELPKIMEAQEVQIKVSVGTEIKNVVMKKQPLFIE